MKKLHSGKGALQCPKQNRTNNTEQELSEKMTTQKKREEKKRSNTESYKSGLNYCKFFLSFQTVTKDRQLFIWGVSVTHSGFFVSGEFLAHIP